MVSELELESVPFPEWACIHCQRELEEEEEEEDGGLGWDLEDVSSSESEVSEEDEGSMSRRGWRLIQYGNDDCEQYYTNHSFRICNDMIESRWLYLWFGGLWFGITRFGVLERIKAWGIFGGLRGRRGWKSDRSRRCSGHAARRSSGEDINISKYHRET